MIDNMYSSGVWAIVGTVFVVGGSFYYLLVRNRELGSKEPSRALPPKSPYESTIVCTHAALVTDMEITRQRPIDKLPISVDLPRLARKTVIMDGDQVVLNGLAEEFASDTEDEQISRARLIQRVWATLSEMVGEESEMYSDLAERLQGGGEVALQLALWLKMNISSDTRVIRILKVCNQSILASAVVRMKSTVGMDWPYKDLRGQWTIQIRKTEDGCIHVTHTKKEISYESNSLYDTQHFSFTWELQMIFDPNVEVMQKVSVVISEMDFVEGVSQATRDAIVQSFNECEIIEPFSVPM